MPAEHRLRSLGMSASALAIAPHLSRMFTRSNRPPSGPVRELNALLDRIHQPLYDENLPVLASWWLKTVYYAGHNRVWWEELDSAIAGFLKTDPSGVTAETVREIQAWARQELLSQRKHPKVLPILRPPFRPDLTPDQAAAYLSRVLNEWLPAEVARLLTSEAESDGPSEGAMPAVTIATALERLLLRERHSPASLELLLDAAWLSPKNAYPSDVEILSNVILALLGRTTLPDPPLLPAAHVAGEFADNVDRAQLVSSPDGDELHVPLDAAQALEILEHDPIHFASIIVTMDGRWWESARLQRGQETVIVYRPGGRLRIDFSHEHARLVVPWPDSDPASGVMRLPAQLVLFGRNWRGRAWDRSAERAWLHLEFSGTLSLSEPQTLHRPDGRRLRPASVEIAWSEVEQALAMNASDSVERLHRGDLIPLARALVRLIGCLHRAWPVSHGEIEKSLRSIRYLHAAVVQTYGPIPWRVLPARSRSALLKRRGTSALSQLCADVFDGAPPDQQAPRRAA